MNEEAGRTVSGFVTFSVGAQIFGIPVGEVKDVFVLQGLTYVPHAPPGVAGVLNLRGRIVTAVDVRNILGLPKTGAADPPMAIGIERGNESYALIVDRVGEVILLDPEQFEPVTEILDQRWRRVSRGIYRLEDNLLVEINVDLLIDIETARAA